MAGPIASLTERLHCIYTRLSVCSSSPRVLTAASRQSELIASDLSFLYSPIIVADRSPIAWVAHLQDAVSSVVGIQPYVPGIIAICVTWSHRRYIFNFKSYKRQPDLFLYRLKWGRTCSDTRNRYRNEESKRNYAHFLASNLDVSSAGLKICLLTNVIYLRYG